MGPPNTRGFVAFYAQSAARRSVSFRCLDSRGMRAGVARDALKRLRFQNDDVCERVIHTSGKKMEDPAMEDSDELLLPVWRANLVLLTREVGAATRLARMMTFSASYLKLMLSGQREFSEEFVRGIEAVTGLPNRWMNTPDTEQDLAAHAREAIVHGMPPPRFPG